MVAKLSSNTLNYERIFYIWITLWLISHISFAVYLNHYWHGLRFLRALIILNISDVLVYLRLINTSSSIRLTQLVSIFITMVSYFINKHDQTCLLIAIWRYYDCVMICFCFCFRFWPLAVFSICWKIVETHGEIFAISMN